MQAPIIWLNAARCRQARRLGARAGHGQMRNQRQPNTGPHSRAAGKTAVTQPHPIPTSNGSTSGE
ncbi:MAG: hypothetical protein ACPIOQ_82125, partial [Promethearchaeia archaeon]